MSKFKTTALDAYRYHYKVIQNLMDDCITKTNICFQLRDLISRCICSNPSKRPDIAEVLSISEQMNAHFQVNMVFCYIFTPYRFPFFSYSKVPIHAFLYSTSLI